MEINRGFFESLFDLSFSSFITTKLIKVLYLLWLVGAGLTALRFILTGLQSGLGSALARIIGAALAFLFAAIYGRVLMELIIVVFRIAEHTGQIAERAGREPSLDV